LKAAAVRQKESKVVEERERERQRSLLTINRWLKVGKYNASCG
jgi:hypothetical protein